MFPNLTLIVSSLPTILKSPASPSPIPHTTLVEVSNCTCQRLRKTARRLTQIYDEALAPSGLTVTQFGILSNLAGHGDLSIGRLAEHMGMDPTSLNRTLKPLQREKLVGEKIDLNDKRVRLIVLTKGGLSILPDAIKFWKSAQHLVTAQLGATKVADLNRHLDLSLLQLRLVRNCL